MYRVLFLFLFTVIFSLTDVIAREQQDYKAYHLQVIEAEKLIAVEKYRSALDIYEQLFNEYEFVFLREYQIAAQLALYENDRQKAIAYIRQGIVSGWTLKSIKRNKYLTPLLEDGNWKSIKKEYPNLRRQYESGLNQNIRKQVKKMFSKDQWKAFKVLLRFSSKAQETYTEKKFAPHSERQIEALSKIIETYGYPGEKLIGNSYWVSTILSHHNSISIDYNKKDTLYSNLVPILKRAIKKGEMSPYEFALIDDWRISTLYNRKKPSYGILDPPKDPDYNTTNELRKNIYVRPYALRDSLIGIQKKTGMNFYLSDRWY